MLLILLLAPLPLLPLLPPPPPRRFFFRSSVAESERRRPAPEGAESTEVARESGAGGCGLLMLLVILSEGVRSGAGLRSDAIDLSDTGVRDPQLLLLLLLLLLLPFGSEGDSTMMLFPFPFPFPFTAAGLARRARRNSSAALLKDSGTLIREPPRWMISAGG